MATDVVSRVTTVIAVVDKATAPVTALQRKFQALAQSAHAAGDKLRAIADKTGLSRVPGILHSINAKALELGKSFVEMMLPLLGLGAGGATVAGLLDLAEGMHRFVEEGSRLSVVSERIGTSVKSLQDLEYAASLFKVPAEVMDTNLGRLNRTLAQVAAGKNKEATKLLGFVGIAARDAHGHVKDAAQVVPVLADVMAKIHNPAQRARLAVGLFGKGGQALIPVLMHGSKAFRDAARDMDQLGRMSAAETHEAHELEISQLRLHRAFDRVQEIIGGALAPYTKKAVDAVRLWIVHNRKLIETKVHEWVDRGAKAIERLWERMKKVDWDGWLTSLGDMWTKFTGLVDTIGGVNGLLKIFIGYLVVDTVVSFANGIFLLGSALWTVAAALTTIEAPVWLVIGLIALGSYLVYKYWKQIKAWAATPVDWSGLWTGLAEVLQWIERGFTKMLHGVEAKLDAVARAFDTVWDRVKDNFFVRMISRWFGIGGGAASLNVAVPGGWGGPPAATWPAPNGGGGGNEGWKGVPYRMPANGSVDVTVNIDGAPQGTRVNTETKGTGLKANTNVGYSMHHLRR
jgi:hypothetical protein